MLLAVFVFIYSALICLLWHCGLLVSIVTMYFVSSLNCLILGFNWKTFSVPSGIATAALLLGIVLYSFWRSLGTRRYTADSEVEAASGKLWARISSRHAV